MIQDHITDLCTHAPPSPFPRVEVATTSFSGIARASEILWAVHAWGMFKILARNALAGCSGHCGAEHGNQRECNAIQKPLACLCHFLAGISPNHFPVEHSHAVQSSIAPVTEKHPTLVLQYSSEAELEPGWLFPCLHARPPYVGALWDATVDQEA